MESENIRHKIWGKKNWNFTLHHNAIVPLDFFFQNRGLVSGKAGVLTLQQHQVNTGMSNGTSGEVVQNLRSVSNINISSCISGLLTTKQGSREWHSFGNIKSTAIFIRELMTSHCSRNHCYDHSNTNISRYSYNDRCSTEKHTIPYIHH